MARRRRLSTRTLPLGLLVGLLGLAACGDDAAPDTVPREVRQQRLQPRDLAKVEAQARERERVTDDSGALLPSDHYVAGVQLPRGLEEVRASEGQWYYNTRSSLEALRAYFGPRLFTGKISLGGRGVVTYVHAKPKGDRQDHVVDVRLGPAPADPRRNQVHISEVPLNPASFPSEAETRAKLKARRQYAD